MWLFVLALLAQFAPKDARSALDALAGPSAADRSAAERWLAANLEFGDLAVVAEVGATAGVEVRSRLAQALGSNERHFALSAQLASDYEQGLRTIGKDALEQMLARWTEQAPDLAPISALEIASRLQESSEAIFALHPEVGTLDQVLDRLVRIAGRNVAPEGAESLGVALDPLLAAETQDVVRPDAAPSAPETDADEEDRAAETALQGSYPGLLHGVAKRAGARLEGFGFGGPHPWIRVASLAEAANRDGGDVVVRWCREVLEYPDRARGEGAARALAGCAWPAALRWLEARWSEHGDRNALSGLLLAAGRGRVVPGLATAAMTRELLEQAERAMTSATPDGLRRAEEAMRALRAIGPRGADGADLAELVAAGWAAARPEGQRLRLAVLQGMGRAPEPFRQKLRELLSAPGGAQSADLRLEALFTLAASETSDGRSASALQLATPGPLFERAQQRANSRRLQDALRQLEIPAPAAWRDPSALPAGWKPKLRTRALEWWLATPGSEEIAAVHLSTLAAALEPGKARLGDLLAERVSRGGEPVLARVFALALGRAQDAGARDRLERLALLAGVLPRDRHAALLESILASGVDEAELGLLGALAASAEAGDRARDELVLALQKGPDSSAGMSSPWVRALERAVWDLRRNDMDLEADALMRKVRIWLRDGAHPLKDQFQIETGHPRPPGVVPVLVEAIDPRLVPWEKPPR